MEISKYLLDKIKNLPAVPGCYIFHNKAGDIIYIGKSKSLKNRVRQYFQRVDEKEGKYKNLIREIADVEIMLTPTERDALLLECRLIKTHKPRYNSQMVKERIYPFILININQEYPAISIVEQFQADNACYGFFYNEEAAIDTIRILNSIWQTPLCGKASFTGNSRPCLNYHLKKCCAPCSKMIDREEYLHKIAEIRKCLSGKQARVRRTIHQEMNRAAELMNFEKAAEWRDILGDLDLLKKRSERLNTFLEESKVFLFFRAYGEKDFSIFYIEDGLTKIRMDIRKETETCKNPQIINNNKQPALNEHIEELLERIIPMNEAHQSNQIEPVNRAYSNDSFFTTYPDDEKFMTICLTDIFADKYFISLPKRLSRDCARKKLLAGIVNFSQ